jgi:hypothetical protein
MKRALAALTIGGVFVGLAVFLGHHEITTPIPFWVLLPGILVGAVVPGSGFSPEGDTHPWGLVSTLIVFAVNTVVYGGLAYIFAIIFGRFRRDSK